MSSALNGPDTVTGASGHLGSQVIESIVAITRAPGKRLAVQSGQTACSSRFGGLPLEFGVL